MEQKRWHTLGIEETLKELNTSAKGLGSKEAEARLQSYGLNELEEKKKTSALRLVMEQFKNVLVIVLVFAAAVSILIGELIDGTVIAAILVINALLGFYQERKAENALAALKKMTASKSTAVRDGKKIVLESKLLVPGDILVMTEGDKVPADCRILEQSNVKIDESLLTGESVPVTKQTEQVGDVVLADRRNMAFSGTSVVYGNCTAVVTETGMGTEFGKIAEQLQGKEESTPLQRRLETMGRQLSVIILFIAALVFAGGYLHGIPLFEMFLVAVALAVAAIPEGLPAIVTITLSIGLVRMSKKNAIVRRLPATEGLGSVTAICVPGNTPIVCNPSLKTIESISETDNVLGIDGNFHPVLKTYKRAYTGDVIRIKPMGLPWLTITPEHPVLICKIKKSRPVINFSRPRKIKILGVSWVPAKDVKQEDMVLIPRIKNEQSHSFILRTGRERKEVKIELDEELAELFGWYLAEGCTSSRKGSHHIVFYLGKHETENVKRVTELIEKKLHLKAHVYETSTSIRIVAINQDLVNFLKSNFGENAKTKKIPDFVMKSPKGVVSRFLYGYLKGDGSVSNYHIRFTTASKTISYQLIILLAKLGIRGRLHKRKVNSSIIRGRAIEERIAYEVFIGGTQAKIIHPVKNSIEEEKNNFFIADDDFVYVPIRAIKRVEASFDVFNIETASQTYALPFIVHNCSDKTGTLTKNEMNVRKLYTDGEVVDFDTISENKRSDETGLLLTTGLLCNNATEQTGDPTEIALVRSARKYGLEDIREKKSRLKETPFASERKMMSVVYDVGGKKLFAKGAVEEILSRCSKLQENGAARLLTNADRKRILDSNQELTKDALRVLAFAYKPVADAEAAENDLIFIGLQAMMDPPRAEVKDAIAKCYTAGIKVVMITGDHQNTAEAIARELGIEGRSVTGIELEKMKDDEFEKIVDDIAIYARTSPDQKTRITEALRKKGHIVAMSGDGVNDAPALKKADIGIAVGSGTDVTKEAADIVLTDDNFSTIVSAIEEGRGIYDNIKKFVNYLLSANFGEIIIIFVAILLNLPLPLLPLQLLWINITTDGLPALALGVEAPDKDIMTRKPRDPKEKILNRPTLIFIISIGIMLAVGVLGLFAYHLPDVTKARTVAFTALTIAEMFLAVSFRSRLWIHKIGFFGNKKLVLAIASSVALQLAVLYTPIFDAIFDTVPLGLNEWGLILGFCIALFAIVELIKGGISK